MERFQPNAQLKIAITSDCNNNCPICLNQTTRSRNKAKALSLDTIYRLLDQGAKLGMVGSYWTGGEPLVRFGDLLKAISYSKNKGLIPTLITNGGLLAAEGNYKIANQDLLRASGIHDQTPEALVDQLRTAGLERVYFSVDNSHSTLASPASKTFDLVPTEVLANGLKAFIQAGYANKHPLEAIGYRLRLTATSSGDWRQASKQILEDLFNKAGLGIKERLSTTTYLCGSPQADIYLKHIEISNTGDAATFDHDLLEDRSGEDLFTIACPHFKPTNQAYDKGKYHRDLYVDSDGLVYTCGNHAFAIGNIHKESLQEIIDGVNHPKEDHEFGLSRRVFYILLYLSESQAIGNQAIGHALKMIHRANPDLTSHLRTQCGACNQLGSNPKIQSTLIDTFESTHGPSSY